MSLLKYYHFISRRFISGGSEVVNFGERTLSWMISSAHSHMITHGDRYSFQTQEIKLLSEESNDMKTLIPCSEQITSQWLIKRMMNNKHYIHSFSGKSGNFDYIKIHFKLSTDSVETANETDNDKNVILHCKQNNIRIEKANINELCHEWINRHKYNEYFDVIFDELALDNIITMDIDNYVQTTIYGYALKQTGILYVCHRKIPGDIAGTKLRQKIGSLYPNTHFELIAERDTAWSTQFIFLKVDSCSNLNTERDINRIDHVGDTHYQHNQNRIWGQSEVMVNAARDMKEGMDRVFDALGIKDDKDEGPNF